MGKEIVLEEELARLIDVDFSPMGEITTEVVERNVRDYQTGRYSAGSVRLMIGRVDTDKGWEAYKKRVLSKNLP